MSSYSIESVYRMVALGGLVVGRTINSVAQVGLGGNLSKGPGWYIPQGIYTPRQIVEGCAPLLETVLHNLGQDPPNTVPARKMLLDNLASNLRVDTRESTLQIPYSTSDARRREIAQQAVRIGETIVQYAYEISLSKPKFDSQLTIRSPCEGHLLNAAVAGLMFGPRSQTNLMQVFNEYLHQIVLLRDSLILFQNYEEVLIPIKGETGRQVGMRNTEEARSQFLAHLMTRGVSQSAIVNYAKAVLAPKLSVQGGYGFQYAHGLVLPAFLAGSSSPRLLYYCPAHLDFESSVSDILFDYKYPDYYSAPRAEIPESITTLAPDSWSSAALHVPTKILESSIAIEKLQDSSRCLLQLRLEIDNDQCITVDLGQISRGFRYAYRVPPHSNHSSLPSDESRDDEINIDASMNHKPGFSQSSLVHSPMALLTQSTPGLLSSSKQLGIHVIPTNHALLTLALLGRIYPENVVLLHGDQPPQGAERVGKSLRDSPKFVIYSQESKFSGIAAPPKGPKNRAKRE